MKQTVFLAGAVLLIYAACTQAEPKMPEEECIPVEFVELNVASQELTEGDSFQLIATICPEDATNQNLSWSSDSPLIATVTDSGLVHAKQAGTAIVNAITEDGNKTASCQFTVFPRLAPSVTIDATTISAVSAVLIGKANLGNTSISDVKAGIMYSESSSILATNSIMVEATAIEAEYYYHVPITDLAPETTYYYRSYVNQAGIYFYGEIKSFTTKEVASLIITSEANILGPTEVCVKAKLDLTDCIYSSIIWGFYYGSDSEHLSSFIRVDEIDEENNFSYRFKSLTPNTSYLYQAAVIINGREFLGKILSYSTQEINATVNTLPTSSITEFSATLNASYSTTNADTLRTDVWIIWSKREEGIEKFITSGYGGKSERCELNSDGSFSCSIEKLLSNTTYYYTSAVSIQGKWYYGDVLSFTTLAISDSVNTLDAFDITEFHATLSGQLNINSSESLNRSVWFLVSSKYSTKEELISNCGKWEAVLNEDGSFSVVHDPCTCGTTYYYVAAAKVYDTVIYGDLMSFTTRNITPKITTQNASNITCTSASLNGSLELSTIEEMDTSVWLLYSDTANSLYGLKSNGIKIDKNHDGVQIITSQNDVTTFSYDRSRGGFIPNKTYYYIAVAQIKKGSLYNQEFYGDIVSFKTLSRDDIPEGAVDLGLSVCWATCNIGASKPQEYGERYAWGETEPKNEYTANNYKWYNHNGMNITKYSPSVDDKTVLETGENGDDVASKLLGGKWRMPGYWDWSELFDRCTWSFTDNYDGSGVKGIILTSKLDGYTDKSIFLPYTDTETWSWKEGRLFARYWSSSLCTISYLDKALKPQSSNPFFAGFEEIEVQYDTNYDYPYRYCSEFLCFVGRELGLYVRPVVDD